ncbi:uncharacterized protein LOC135469600 [Liolophura sinensis]|uniref:uncharacterized protein LOC135469600 n=1 Tax=Liolophura sinensis TaxID=3198878 RepID=UPI00315887E4
MYEDMDYSGSQDGWGGWQNTRKRHLPNPSFEGQYRRPRLDNSQQSQNTSVPPLLPPPLPPIKQVSELPSAFLEFSRRLYNSTIADLGLENPVDLFNDTAGTSRQSFDYGHGRSNENSFSRTGSEGKRWSTLKSSYKQENSWGGYSQQKSEGQDYGSQRGRFSGGRGRSFGSAQWDPRGGRGCGGDQQRARGRGKLMNATRGVGRGAGRGTRGSQKHTVGREPIRDQSMVHNNSNLTVAEKIRRFCGFLKQEPIKVNAIQTIENGLTSSKLHLTADYSVEELLKYSSLTKFTGCFTLGGHFIVRAVGPSKRELKHEIYTKALEILTTKSVVEILCLVDPGVEALRSQLGNVKDEEITGEWNDVSSIPDTGGASDSVDTKPRLESLLRYIRDNPVIAENCIGVVEQSLSQSRCGLKSEFTCIAHTQKSGKRVFKGIVCLGHVPIAHGHGLNKRDAKHDTYTNALAALKTRSVENLLSGRNIEGFLRDGCWEEMEYFPITTEKSAAKKANTAAAMAALELCKSPNLTQQMACLCSTLRDTPVKTNKVNSIDCLSVQIGLTPVCYYKKLLSENEQRFLRCELYINDILVGSTDATTKKDAQIKTYEQAFDLLTSSPSHAIMKNQPRKSFSDNDSDILEKVVKGAGKLGDSNLDRLSRLDIDVYEDWKSPDDLVVMEFADWTIDRERNAFNILIRSATFSGLLLEWSFPTKQALHNECTVTLQKSISSNYVCTSKMSARNKACADILNQFYSCAPVIQTQRQDTGPLLSWEDLEAGSASWTIPPSGAAQSFIGEGELRPEQEKTVKYAFHLLEEFEKRNTLEEMSFGPGIPELVSKAITRYAKHIKLRVDLRHTGGKPTSIHVFKRVSAAEIVQYLTENGGQSGKYRLLTDEKRPYIHMKASVTSLDSSPATGHRKNNGSAQFGKHSQPARHTVGGKQKETSQHFGFTSDSSFQHTGQTHYGSSFNQTTRGNSFPGSRGQGFSISGRGTGKGRVFSNSGKGRGFSKTGKGRGFNKSVKSLGFSNIGKGQGFTNSRIGRGFSSSGMDQGYNNTGKSQSFTSGEDPTFGGGGHDFSFQGQNQDFSYNDSGTNDYTCQWEQMDSGNMQIGAKSCDFTSDQNFINFEGNNEYF